MDMEEERNISANLFLQHLSLPVAVCDRDFRVVYGNQALKQLFGPIEPEMDIFSYLSIPDSTHHIFPLILSEDRDELLFTWCIGSSQIPYEIRQTKMVDNHKNLQILIEFKASTETRDLIVTDAKSISDMNCQIEQDKEMLLKAGNALKNRDRGIKEKDQKIDQQEKMLQQIFSNTHLLIAYLNPDLTIARANEALAEAAERGIKEIEGQGFFDVFYNKDLEEVFVEALKSEQARVVHNQKILFRDQPGFSSKYWDWSLQPVIDKAKKIYGLIFILIDVSKRVESENQLARAREKLDDAKRLSDIGTLAATVAHELRNPLGVMAAAIFNISRKNSDKKISPHINSIDKKIRESQQTINNLLNYARLKEPILKKIHIFHLIRECIEDSEKRFLTSRTEIYHDYEVLKDFSIYIDPFQIREVISNVLNNAIQALYEFDHGIIRVKGLLTEDYMELSIKDNGPGIDLESIDDVFRPFFTLKPKGTGLGLTICRDILMMHRGHINISSKPKRGTAVSILLPRSDTP